MENSKENVHFYIRAERVDIFNINEEMFLWFPNKTFFFVLKLLSSMNNLDLECGLTKSQLMHSCSRFWYVLHWSNTHDLNLPFTRNVLFPSKGSLWTFETFKQSVVDILKKGLVDEKFEKDQSKGFCIAALDNNLNLLNLS